MFHITVEGTPLCQFPLRRQIDYHLCGVHTSTTAERYAAAARKKWGRLGASVAVIPGPCPYSTNAPSPGPGRSAASPATSSPTA
jgi:hypothetical protein